jgi:hypothetical protein
VNVQEISFFPKTWVNNVSMRVARVRMLASKEGKKESLAIGTFLPPFIAVGSIGIGAIWTAMLARRQEQPTKRVLAEQNVRGCSILRTMRDIG